MPDIKITSSTIYPEKYVGGLPVATPGYDIKCVLTVENKEPRLHSEVWWTIHDRLADKRLESGTQAMAPGGVLNILRYVDMPSKPIKLEFWTGYVDDDGLWRYTDSKTFREFNPLITKGTLAILASDPTRPYPIQLNAKAYVDAKYVGTTPIVVSKDAGSYMVQVKRDGYEDSPVVTVVVVPGAAVTAPFILIKEIPLPKLCLPSITGFDVPTRISPTIPKFGSTISLDSFPVDFRMSGGSDCQFPIGISLFVGTHEIKKQATSGRNSIDIADSVRSVLSSMSLPDLKALKGMAISLKYPTKIEYSSPGTVRSEKTLTAYTHLNLVDLSIPTPVTPPIPTPVTPPIPTPVTPPSPTPECTITAADIYVCPDGSVIRLNECKNGVKVPTGAVCPTTDVTQPECTITAADFYTCPDGSVIQLNECRNGVKVPTGATCPTTDVTPCTITAADIFTCADGTQIQLNKCVNGVKVPTGEKCPKPGCEEGTFMSPYTCADGSVIHFLKCVNGGWVSSGQECPKITAPSRKTKVVYVTAPMLTRVGKKINIVAKVYCDAEVVGGEKAVVTVSGNIITTTHTRNGTVKASWTPVTPGIYNICVTVPESSACNAYASQCTTVQVVRELSTPEIEAAEKAFEEAQERIGELMERI